MSEYYFLRSEDLYAVNLPIVGYVAYHRVSRQWQCQTPREAREVERAYEDSHGNVLR